MAKFFIADEVNDSYTADVLPSGALETASLYQYAYLNSAVGSTEICSNVACILHSVNVSNTSTAANAVLYLGNLTASACASAQATASGVCRIGLGVRGSYLFDAYVSRGLSAYIAAQDCDGITITYQTA